MSGALRIIEMIGLISAAIAVGLALIAAALREILR